MTAESADKLGQAAAPKPRWRDPAWLLRCLLTYALALVGGYVASLLSVPLPWMLGPFFLCGVLSASGLKLAFLPMSREFGQLAVGLTVGLRFTPRSDEHTSELQSLMRISYAVYCLKKKTYSTTDMTSIG